MCVFLIYLSSDCVIALINVNYHIESSLLVLDVQCILPIAILHQSIVVNNSYDNDDNKNDGNNNNDNNNNDHKKK